MRRTATILAVIALAPLLMGGGINPPPPGGLAKVSGPAVSAVVVIDPRGDGATGGYASIRLQKGSLLSGATFSSPAPFGWSGGCDSANVVNQTDYRFLYGGTGGDRRLIDWIPWDGSDSQGDVLGNLFSAIGINIVNNWNSAVITDIDNPVCTTDPTPEGTSPPGFLSFQAVIQFIK